MKTLLHIENLDCPVCAEALQADIAKLKGVQAVTVDYVSQTISLETEDETAVMRTIKTANHFEEVHVLVGQDNFTKPSNRRVFAWLKIGIAAALLLAGILLHAFIDGRVSGITAIILYAVAYLTVGYPVLISTAKNLAKGRIFDENFLMTLASIGAVALGEYSEAVLVMLLYQIGELLQSIAVGSSRRSVSKLVELKSEWATLLMNGEQKQVKPEELQTGDVIVVKAGERIPTDCELISESALIDTKSLTGEPLEKRITRGQEILSGTINAGGMVEMKVLRIYCESAVGKILDMVENAASGKAKPEKFITKFARYYTPIVCILAVMIATLVPLFSGIIMDGRWYFRGYDRWLQSALTFLVVSCPCALIISVPLTYFSGIGVCARAGILVKGATYLDEMAKAKTVAFDKTGTLTEGSFTVCGVHPEKGVTQEELLSLAAAVERGSAHPIAKAFLNVKTTLVAQEIKEKAGKGLLAIVDGARIVVGNAALLQEEQILLTEKESMHTVIYVAKDGAYIGAIEVGDQLRAEAKDAIAALKNQGVTNLVMLTGDSVNRAQKIANEVGMYELKADLLPLDKQRYAEEMQKQGGLVYVGDGINDAPVMAVASCAVSMGKLGSAAAVEASDMVLISDNLQALSKAFGIARKTRKTVFENIIFSIVMKIGFMVLGACGVLPLWLAVFADVGVMLLAVLNSFKVRFYKGIK